MMSKSLETKGTRCETHDSQQLGVVHVAKAERRRRVCSARLSRT